MRNVAIVVGVLIALALGGAYVAGLFDAGEAPESTAAACLKDDEIDAAKRDAAAAAARAFYDRVLKGDATAHDALTDEAKKLVTADAFAQMMRTIAGNGPYEDMRLANAYHPTVSEPQRATCAADGALKSVSVSAIPDATQIHTILEARTRNNDWAFTAWMMEQDGAWRVHAFYVAPASLVGLGPAELFAMAEAQQTKGHTFSARLLYAVARGVADRGPNIDLGIGNDIATALAKQTPPVELEGAPPFKWKLDGTTFDVEFVALVGTDKRLGLMLLHRDPAWDGKDTGRAERRNKRLIDAFVKTHPEYKEVFAYIVARILEPGTDTGWGTVFDAKKGYDMGEPATTRRKPR